MTREPIHKFTVDYREDRGAKALVNKGFWVHNLPRLIPFCRAFGHRVVVDGVDYSNNGERHRWACCDRCGVRLMQPIDSDLEIGQPYTDPVPDHSINDATGVIGGQLVLLGGNSTVDVEVKIGNKGSEHTLAGNIALGKLGALYLHTEKFGTFLQRRLNPTGYESRVTGFGIHDGRFYGRIWATRNGSSREDPPWQQWSFGIDPRTILFGPKRYSYTDHGAPVEAIVRMPHGDDYPVRPQLQRQSFGRQKLKRKRLSWCVDWNTIGGGIPTRNTDRGRISGSGVNVSDAAATDGGWEAEACVAIAAQMTKDRNRYGFESTPRTEVA